MQSLLILLLALAAQDAISPFPPGPPLPQTGEGIVQGVVKRADTGQPIPEVTVTLYTFLTAGNTAQLTAEQRRRELRTITDSSGRFTFEKLPENLYVLTAGRENYFGPPAFGGTALTYLTTGAVIDKNHKNQTVTMTLIPGGVVSGTLRDPDGAPASKVYVGASVMTYKNGRRELKTVKDVLVDDLGQYRLWGLPPGDYYIRAGRAAECGEAQSGIASAYFPGVAEPELASVIKLTGGMEVTANFATLKERPVKISGRVLSTVPGIATPMGMALVPHESLSKIGEGKQVPVNTCYGTLYDGPFETTVTRTGTYDVWTAAYGRAGSDTFNHLYPNRRVTVHVGEKDVEGLTVTIERGSEIAVRVNAGTLAVTPLQNFFVGIRPADTISSVMTDEFGRSQVSPEGIVQFQNVAEGTYALTNLVLPAGAYFADLRQGARSIYDTGLIEIAGSTAEPVEIVLARGGGKVEGTIQGPAAKLFIPAVSLIPQGTRRSNPSFIKTVAASSGKFTIEDIPPGEYKLFAWETLPTGAEANAEFMSRYEGRGRSITVTSGGTLSNITLPLIEN